MYRTELKNKEYWNFTFSARQTTFFTPGIASVNDSVRRADLASRRVLVDIMAARTGYTAEKERISEILRDFKRFREIS